MSWFAPSGVFFRQLAPLRYAFGPDGCIVPRALRGGGCGAVAPQLWAPPILMEWGELTSRLTMAASGRRAPA